MVEHFQPYRNDLRSKSALLEIHLSTHNMHNTSATLVLSMKMNGEVIAVLESAVGRYDLGKLKIFREQFKTSPIANLAVTDPLPGDTDAEEAGVFAEAPGLLAHLRDAGLSALTDHILLEFKAGLRDYKKQKWHALLVVEEMALSVSAPLCRPLSALCARLAAAAQRLAPALTHRLRARLANDLDQYIFEEVVMESWFNTGGTIQFTHDVKRNLVPAFAPPNKVASQCNQLPKLLESCKLLNMDYDDARRLRAAIAKQPQIGADSLANQGIRHLVPFEALQILNQRTDLSDATSPSSVMELF